MNEPQVRERSPGIKLLFAILIGAALTIPLLLIYALVYDRQDQSQTAQASINAGWGGPQVVAGPIVAVPYKTNEVQTVEVNGKAVTQTVEVEHILYISPTQNSVKTQITPQERRKSIYTSVLFEAQVSGKATFALPDDLPRFGVTREALIWDRAELRVGASDARGLTKGGKIVVNGKASNVEPGKGPAATAGEGFFTFLNWDGLQPITVDYAFGLRGSRSISLVPRGGETVWQVSSPWTSPSFSGGFLPDTRDVGDTGFSARYAIDKLALGQPPVASADYGVPSDDSGAIMVSEPLYKSSSDRNEMVSGNSRSVTVGLVETVDIYSKVNRSVKYGFLFIGFTFLAFLLFDIVGSARVAVAEYFLVGAGLILFFALLLAFAEVIGFTLAYILASAAIIGLLTAYSASVLKSWGRARFIGALLVGLYALLFVLLNLEAWSLLIGSVLLFVALAGVMFATRKIDWASVGRREPQVS